MQNWTNDVTRMCKGENEAGKATNKVYTFHKVIRVQPVVEDRIKQGKREQKGKVDRSKHVPIPTHINNLRTTTNEARSAR